MANGGEENAVGDHRVSTETAFAKILGRSPTEAEREHLYRVRDALGLRDNDAFWSILIALEYYDSLYREYPRRLGETTARAIGDAQVAFAKAAEHESAKAQRVLSEQVAKTSVAMAKKLAERSIGLHQVTALFGSVVAFGAVCMVSGYQLAGPEKPFWIATVNPTRWARIASAVLAAPAGWMVFLLLLPGAAKMGAIGWKMSHEVGGGLQAHLYGWGLVSVAVLGAVACLVAVVRFT